MRPMFLYDFDGAMSILTGSATEESVRAIPNSGRHSISSLVAFHLLWTTRRQSPRIYDHARSFINHLHTAPFDLARYGNADVLDHLRTIGGPTHLVELATASTALDALSDGQSVTIVTTEEVAPQYEKLGINCIQLLFRSR